jgi:hypothetical protein
MLLSVVGITNVARFVQTVIWVESSWESDGTFSSAKLGLDFTTRLPPMRPSWGNCADDKPVLWMARPPMLVSTGYCATKYDAMAPGTAVSVRVFATVCSAGKNVLADGDENSDCSDTVKAPPRSRPRHGQGPATVKAPPMPSSPGNTACDGVCSETSPATVAKSGTRSVPYIACTESDPTCRREAKETV